MDKVEDPYEHDLFSILYLEEDGRLSDENRDKLEFLLDKNIFPIVITERKRDKGKKSDD